MQHVTSANEQARETVRRCSSRRALLSAAKRAESERQCEELLRRGCADWVALRGPVEISPLHLAVERELPEVVAILLALGHDVGGVQHKSRHIYGSLEETPLCCAAARGFAHIAALLIDKQAAMDGLQAAQLTPGGERRCRSPFFCAVERGHRAVVELLLRHSVDLGGMHYQEEAAGRTRTRTCLDAATSEEMRSLLLSASAPAVRPGTAAVRPGTGAYPRPGTGGQRPGTASRGIPPRQ